MDSEKKPWVEVLGTDPIVSASQAEKALKLGAGTIASDYLAGKIPAARRKARRGGMALVLLAQDVWANYGPSLTPAVRGRR